MPWRKARFKGKDVWVAVDADGELAEQLGRVSMRYSDAEGAKLYRAGVANLDVDPSGPVRDLPEGVDAEDRPATSARAPSGRGSGFGSARTRTAAQAEGAARDAQGRIDALPDGTTVIFTDGGCRGNPGPAGSGVFARFADGRTAEVARALGRGTNNIAELTAIEIALDLLDEAGLPADAPVAVFSDSTYAAGVLTKGWKAKANVELIAGIRARLAKRSGVRMHWVAGHAGVSGNERADALASAGVAGRDEKRWG